MHLRGRGGAPCEENALYCTPGEFLMNSNVSWLGPLILIVGRLLYVEAQNTRASVKGDTLVFRASWGVLTSFVAGIGIFSVLSITRLGKEETWLIVSGIVVVILFALGWPSTIMIDSGSIVARVWWRRAARIPWSEVVDLQRGAGGDYTVYGREGTTITFSRFHVDPKRFESEVLKRSGLSRVSGLDFEMRLGSGPLDRQ